MQHEKMHWRCCWKPMIGIVLWVGGFLCFIGGLLALKTGGEYWGVGYMTWYWTALILGVLALGKKGGHGCGGGCGGGCCGGKCMHGEMPK